MDVKEEPGSYKVGAQCFDCGHDYGVLDRIPRQEFRHVDEVYETAEESIRELLE